MKTGRDSKTSPWSRRPRTKSKEVPDETRCAMAMIENQDMNVGRVLAKLKEHGLHENTIVV